MSNTTNIPTGLGVPTQTPLDSIKFIQNESLLSNLGASNNLAFKYYDGLIIRCIDENTFYKWREVMISEENTGLLSVDFTYPYNHSAFGINYSNKSFNFFKESNDKTYSVSNIGTGLGIYKNSTTLNDNIQFNLKTLKSNDNSIIATQGLNEINLSVNPTWLQQWLISNSSIICNITSSCALVTGLNANDDLINRTFLPGVMVELDVLSNDDLGTGPTTITSLNTTGLSPLVATANISLDGLSIELTMGTTFSSGVTYSFDYTITDSTLATSTATVFFQDVS